MRHHAYLQSKSTNVSLVKRRSDQGLQLQSLSSFSNENCSSLESQTTISKAHASTAYKVQCKTGRAGAANNASLSSVGVNGSNSNNSKIKLQSKKAFAPSHEPSLDRFGAAHTAKNKSIITDFKPVGHPQFTQSSQSPNFNSKKAAAGKN